MNFYRRLLSATWICTLLAGNALAAPGEIAKNPLFLGTTVPPNILFIVDDSGSMAWEVLLSGNAETIHGGDYFDFDAPFGSVDFTPEIDIEARELCVGYNVMAYDSSKTYSPWFGKNQSGNDYADMPLTAAENNPYFGGATRDLSNDFYIDWKDKNNDNAYQNGECDVSGVEPIWSVSNRQNTYEKKFRVRGRETFVVSIGTSNPRHFESQDFIRVEYRVDRRGPWNRLIDIQGAGDQTREVTVSARREVRFRVTARTSEPAEVYYLSRLGPKSQRPNCPSCVFVADMTTAEQQNYANWYSYYRMREYVSKRALSEIISNGRSRMGLATLHNHNNVGTQIEDVNDISGSNPNAEQNKEALLDNLSRIRSRNGTPLRRKLRDAGDYFRVGVNTDQGLFGFSPSPASPILPENDGGACQQNFSILMSDGYWNSSSPRVGNTDGPDMGNSSFDGGSHADRFSNTLADVAMRYYEMDLAPNMTNSVPAITGVDTNPQQHMVTYTVAFGVNGLLQGNPPNRTDPFNWPRPMADERTTIDDMRHAAWNGRGEFLSAQDPEELIQSLGDAISSIQDRIGSASAVAFNTTSITADTHVYQARFDSGNWTGQLYAYEYDKSGVGKLAWEASSLLNNESKTSWKNRSIYTYRQDTAKGIPFSFTEDYQDRLNNMPDDSGLSKIQIRDLLKNAPYNLQTQNRQELAENQAYGEQLVNFFYGDYSLDGSIFRDRNNKRLGDIIHSSPEYVGAPDEVYPNKMEASPYFDFVKANKSRTPVIYVGANDGMLHAFNANNGKELFAYMPGLLFSDSNSAGLHKLAEKTYGHIPYVDGSVVSRDVFVNGAWKSYLVGGLRAGGKGVFVLDVTKPSLYSNLSDSAAEKLSAMEFTHNDMGFSFSKPQIAKLNNGKWAAIFGNGYNNDPSGDGRAKLFLLYLDGSGYKVLDTEVGSLAAGDCLNSGSDCNGLSSPSLVDVDSDYVVDRIYAGDLQGNMWVFDVSSNRELGWKSAFGTTRPEPLFTACTAARCNDQLGKAINRQPITTKPVAVAHPSIANSKTSPNVQVLFGTGQYLAEGDNSNKELQSFYGIWDAGNNYSKLKRANLVKQTYSYPRNLDLNAGRELTKEPVPYNPTTGINPVMGWYIDLQEPGGSLIGERIAVDPLVSGSYVFFNTTIPNDSMCSAGGSGYLMVADLKTGGQPDEQVFKAYSLGNSSANLKNSYAGIPIDAIPGGSTVINGDKIVVSDSLSRVVSVDFAPISQEKNSRRSAWSIIK